MAEDNARAWYIGAEGLNLLDINGKDGGFEDIIDKIYDHDEIDM